MSVLRLALFTFGYPVSLVVIARFVPVVRERRRRWILWHQAAVAAIVAGFTLRSDWSAVAINSSWFVVAASWYTLGRPRPGAPHESAARPGVNPR